LLTRFGAVDRLLILKKPFDSSEVCQLACALTEKWHLARHAHLKLNQLRGMVDEQTRQLQIEIEQRRRSEEALKESEARYALAAAGSNDGLWEWNVAAQSVFYSSRWKAMIGCAPNEIGASLDDWLDRVNPEDRARLQADLSGHVSGERPKLHSEYRIRHKDGQERWMLCRGLADRDAAGRVARVAGWQSDITDRKLAEEQLRHDARHDLLTGLANRSLLKTQIEKCLVNLQRHPDEQFALLFLDLDRFKGVNDQYGHLAGDELLIGVAKRLAACLRETDTAARLKSGAHEVARFGGDEFVILLERIHDAYDAVGVAERIGNAFKEPFSVAGSELIMRTSIGVAVSNPDYARAEEILRDADTALYQAKNWGRGRYAVFDPTMRAGRGSRWDLEQDLRRAIEQRQFALVFQPLVSLSSHDVLELEALARWVHPSKGEISPGEFVPLAEDTELIAPLGYWVLESACRQWVEWQKAQPQLRNLSISVNVSGCQFAQSAVVENIKAIMAETGINPKRLRLDITENSIMETAPQSLATLARLRELEVRLCLDDFGTGYSSLSYLKRLPIDTLKIDRSFVRAMQADATAKSIVRATVALAHALQMTAVAEGVESKDELNELKALGCDAAQGYYISRPVAAGEVAAMLTRLGQQAWALGQPGAVLAGRTE
jgi:diguanylate cyclase (GGDEF)-like protein/PAS domain S-box-containing protein